MRPFAAPISQSKNGGIAARLALALLSLLASGCAAFPEILHQPELHNPFPQLHRVAILPFFNQSAEATVDGEQVAIEYYSALQKVPGFEVMPVPVAMQAVRDLGVSPQKAEDMQWIARQLNVDVVIAGSITECKVYYPPRLGLAVNWYAANPSFHPIPAGYGLPWGTGEEEFIPANLKREAEFELAREQLKTQTPAMPDDSDYQPTREQPTREAPPNPVHCVPQRSFRSLVKAATRPIPTLHVAKMGSPSGPVR